MCLTSCLVIIPLFFHSLHKLGWVGVLVKLDAEVTAREAKYPTPEELRRLVREYMASKGDNVLALDDEEFLSALKDEPTIKCTSTQVLYAKSLFDEHVKAALQEEDENFKKV